jgi:hypothetical protein
LTVAVADRLPAVNFEQTCREATSGQNRTNDRLEDCVAAEKHARDQLAAQWNSFDAGARTRCASTSTSGHAPSYIELLVCLELEQADKEVRGAGSAAGATIMAPGRSVGDRDGATDPSQNRPGPVAAPSLPAPVAAPSRPAPVAAPSQPAPVAAPSRPAPIPRSSQQPVASAAAPAEPPRAGPLPISPSSPEPAPQPPSESERLHQSLCRSPLGYIVPSCQ